MVELNRAVGSGDLENGPAQGGVRHGVWCFRTPEGRIWREGAYDHGRRSGVWKTWHPNGQLREEVRYTEGRMNGPYSARHPNGVLHESGAHAEGKRIGTWRRFDSSAALAEEWAYDDYGRLHGRYLSRNPVAGQWHKRRFVRGQLDLAPTERIALASRLRQDGDAKFLSRLLPTAEGTAPLLRVLISERLLDPQSDDWIEAELSRDPHAGRVAEKTLQGEAPS
jgi:hypothetical protein